MDAREAQMPGVPDDVGEGDATGPTLRGVKPVTAPRIFGHVAIAAVPDVEAVASVKQDGQPDAEQLQANHERKAAQEFDLLGVGGGATRGESVREKVLDQESANRDDAA